MLPFKDNDKDDGMAMIIAKMAKEDVQPEADPVKEARKVAIQKMFDSFKEDNVDSFMTAMDELKEIESE